MMTQVEELLERYMLEVGTETEYLNQHIAALLDQYFQMDSSLIKVKGPGKLIKVPSVLCLFFNPCPNHIVAARDA